jgi:hypothetical protein
MIDHGGNPGLSGPDQEAVVHRIVEAVGLSGVMRVLNGERLVVPACPFMQPPWQNVWLGSCSHDDYLRLAFLLRRDHGLRLITSWARGSVRRINLAESKVELYLSCLQIGDLGLGHRPLLDQVIKKIIEPGLELCPAEVALALLVQMRHDRLNPGQRVWIAMSPVEDAYGDEVTFYLDRDVDDRDGVSSLVLGCEFNHLIRGLCPEDWVVVVNRKKR